MVQIDGLYIPDTVTYVIPTIDDSRLMDVNVPCVSPYGGSYVSVAGWPLYVPVTTILVYG